MEVQYSVEYRWLKRKALSPRLNLKVRTLDKIFKKISESSENDPEQLAHTSENSPALSLSETDSGPIKSESSQTGATKSNLRAFHFNHRYSTNSPTTVLLIVNDKLVNVSIHF
jgi:hypothetical protein